MSSHENVNYFTCYMQVSIRFYGTNFIAIWKLDFIVVHNKSQPCYHKWYFVVANRKKSKSLILLCFLISSQRNIRKNTNLLLLIRLSKFLRMFVLKERYMQFFEWNKIHWLQFVLKVTIGTLTQKEVLWSRHFCLFCTIKLGAT